MKKNYRKIAIVSLLGLCFSILPVFPAKAATLTSLSDVASTMKASTVANHTITFTTPTGVLWLAEPLF